MTRTERIKKIEARIAELKQTIEDLRFQPMCPICGSDMRKSPKSDRYFCSQEHGHCGILVLNNANGNQAGHGYKSYFSVTSMTDNKVDTILRDDNAFFHVYFGHGRTISKEEYFQPLISKK